MSDSNSRPTMVIRVGLTRDMYPELYDELAKIPITSKSRAQRVLVLANNYLIQREAGRLMAPQNGDRGLVALQVTQHERLSVVPESSAQLREIAQATTSPPVVIEESIPSKADISQENKPQSGEVTTAPDAKDHRVSVPSMDCFNGAEEMFESLGAMSFG